MSFPKTEQLSWVFFFLLGFWTTFPFKVVTWIGIDDILAGTLWPTTVILIAISIPDIVAKLISPAIVSRILFHLSFALLTTLWTVSILLLVIIDDVRVRITGVAVLGLANGFTVITCVRMLAYFEKADLLASAFGNGIQFSIFMASLFYTGLTTWLCVAPRIVIAACIPICFIPLGIYILLDKEPLKDHLQGKAKLVKYTKKPSDVNYNHDKQNEPTHEQTNKFVVLVKSFPIFVFAYLCNFSLHFSMTAVLTTLTFPSSPFLPRDHFQYYRLISDTGIATGGLISFLLGCVGHKWIHSNFFGIRNTGVLVIINVLHLMFFVVASWHRFLPNVIPIFVLCFTQGIVHGMALVLSMVCATKSFSDPQCKGTALVMQEVGISVGRIGAAFLGLFVEKYLREHCTYNLLLGKYCLARIPSPAGWSTNLICKK